MRLGIDFGTSNSAAAIVRDGTLLPIRFGDAEQFRTSVYFPGVVPDPDDFQLDAGQEHELQQLIDSGRLNPAEALFKVPLGRMAEPEEIANAVLFLASSKASYVTGICMSMDGALTPIVV